jgi:tRNA modification GTPase
MSEVSTIAAVSTAYGEGGIGIVRISGKRAGEIAGRLFLDARGIRSGEEADKSGAARRSWELAEEGTAAAWRAFDDEATLFEDRHMRYGHVRDFETGEIIDEALFVFMRAPHTYTGEDVAEIQCHGSVISLRRTLASALACGAEVASPGEFTQRAFLNGRIDLAQAEAVVDVVRAKTDTSARAAVAQLGGGLSARVDEARNLLADALALAAVSIDYPDDDKDFTDDDSAPSEMETALRAAARILDDLIATAEKGRILREGLNVVIAGAANAGKSSLLNALLRNSRAIVTDIPGTTRDSIEERADIRGLPVRLTDTAGVRDAENEIERLGIDRAKEAVAAADLIVFLIDGSKPIDRDDRSALRLIVEATRAKMDGSCVSISEEKQSRAGRMARSPLSSLSDNMILVVSKSDLARVATNDDLAGLLDDAGVIPADRPYRIPLSAKTGEGLSGLEEAIERAVYNGKVPQSDEALVTNTRHKDLLVRAASEIADATGMLSQTGDINFAEVNIRVAYESLGEITGETATDDILDRVFSRFCIGK